MQLLSGVEQPAPILHSERVRGGLTPIAVLYPSPLPSYGTNPAWRFWRFVIQFHRDLFLALVRDRLHSFTTISIPNEGDKRLYHPTYFCDKRLIRRMRAITLRHASSSATLLTNRLS